MAAAAEAAAAVATAAVAIVAAAAALAAMVMAAVVAVAVTVAAAVKAAARSQLPSSGDGYGRSILILCRVSNASAGCDRYSRKQGQGVL